MCSHQALLLLLRCTFQYTQTRCPVSMQACEQIGIPVVEQAPDPKRSHTWREAFVTNWCVNVAPSLRRLDSLGKGVCTKH